MRSRLLTTLGGVALLAWGGVARAEAPGGVAAVIPPTAPAAHQPNPEARLLTIAEARQLYRGPLSQVVLEYLAVMERTVNKDKQALSDADWAPLGELLDRSRFHRVGNFAEHQGWPDYSKLLAGWAQSSWWQGFIWRMSEVPAANGRPGLVYVEAEERSSRSGPVTAAGPYHKLESISVYEIDRSNKIVGLHVYDHRPR